MGGGATRCTYLHKFYDFAYKINFVQSLPHCIERKARVTFSDELRTYIYNLAVL